MLPTILLIDDEEDILEFLERILTPTYRVFKAENADEALSILNSESLQLIVSDITMPGMDGYELCRLIKSTARISHIPLILLTAQNALQGKIKGLEMKADAYIEKPFSTDYLLAQISSLIANREIVVDHVARSPLSHIKNANPSNEDEVFMELIDNMVIKHIEDEELNAQKLAQLLNMTKITLYRKLKNISKYTPNELIHTIKFRKAAEMLSEGRYKMYEVALKTGYKSQSNFARDFNRQYNVSPKEFVDSLKKKNEQ
jgi:two-component system cell cycle response regulator